VSETGASVVGDPPAVRASDFFRRGKPHGSLKLDHRGPAGRFEFFVLSQDNSITVATKYWPPRPIGFEEHEYVTEVEWIPWGFDSVRPFIVCTTCGRLMLRAFIELYEPVGALRCRRCAHIRYKSQARLPAIDRLTERIDSIRLKLGGQPARGVLRTPVPRKPLRMHWTTYDRLIIELYALEDDLADAREEQMAKALDRAYAAREEQMAKMVDRANAAAKAATATLQRLQRLERAALRARER
jgi:hypothetical protein